MDKPWGFSTFRQKNVFPVLLVPKYEPQLTDLNSSTYSSLWQTLSIEWPRIHTWDCEKGNIRLGELYTQEEIANEVNSPEFKLNLEEFSEVADKTHRSEWRSSTDVSRSSIEHLRANNLNLRDKLLYLLKESYD